MKTYFSGLADALSGFGLIFKKGIRRYVMIPLLINISLLSGAIYLLSVRMDSWMSKLLPGWLSWLEWLIWPLFAVTLLLLVFYSFTLLANLIAAPFNSLLAASVEAHLTGQKPVHIDSEKFWKIAVRSVSSEIVKLLYFLKWLVLLLIITVIPGLNLAAPFLWFIYAAWSFSLEYMDYPLANHGMLFKDIRQHNRQHRMRSLGFGSVVFVLTSIPFINFLAMPVAVAGASRLTTRTQEQQHG